VEAPGIEAEPRSLEQLPQPNEALGSNEVERDQTGRGPSSGHADAVELALATALERASAVGQWSLVELLARQLEARWR
jgi:hypothetical protein